MAMNSELEKDTERSGCGLTEGAIPVFASEDWNKNI